MERIKEILRELWQEKNHLILAIDGPCASGKTTLANELQREFDASVIHADDFFLRPEQRTPERLIEAGGNLDRERFREEVIEKLVQNKPFSYRPYLCSERRVGEAIWIFPKSLTIIEGSYSHHPYFGEPYDVKLFCSVSKDEQKRRILSRPQSLHQRFFTEWIPMEEKYFKAFSIQEKADLTVEGNFVIDKE